MKTKTIINYLTILLILAFIVNSANAAQIIAVTPNIEVRANISPTGLNRISVEGGSIDSVEAVDGDIIVRRKKNGEIFVNLPGKRRAKRTIFITSNSGATFTLRLKPIDNLEGQQIFLVEQSAKDSQLKIYDNYQDQLITFYKALYSGKAPKDYKVTFKKKRSKKDKLKITGIATYKPAKPSGFFGEIFEIKNKSKEPKILKPQDFYQKGIRAIKLDSYLLQKGEITKMYVISIKG